MDPQKNASNPAPYPNGQVPLSAQDDGQQQALPPKDTPQEVTVDFSQGQQTAPPEASQPGGLGNMPSITSDPSAGTAASAGNGFDAQPQASQPQLDQPPVQGQNDFGATAPQTAVPQSQDPFAGPPQPGQPGQSGMPPTTGPADFAPGGMPGAPADSLGMPPQGYGPQPQQPDQPMSQGQPFGNPAGNFDPQQSAVPPVAPVPAGKAPNDKKTVFILAGVAVLLILAIIVLVVL